MKADTNDDIKVNAVVKGKVLIGLKPYYICKGASESERSLLSFLIAEEDICENITKITDEMYRDHLKETQKILKEEGDNHV